MFSGTAHVFHQVCQFFLSVLCVFLRVWLWWIKQGCRLLFASPGWTEQFYVWKTTGKDCSEACCIACQNCTVYSVFPSGMTSHSKIAQFKWECIAPFRSKSGGKKFLQNRRATQSSRRQSHDLKLFPHWGCPSITRHDIPFNSPGGPVPEFV